MRALLLPFAAALLWGAPPRLTEVRVGEVVGAQWLSKSGAFFLYATPPEKNRDTVLYVDDIARLALAVWNGGDFAFSLEQAGSQMQIRYLPPEVGVKVAPALRFTTIENTLLSTDRVLKDIAQGRNLGSGLRLGASELFLCGQAMEDWVRSGKTLETFPIVEHVTFYELRAQYRFEGFEGAGVWFDQPRILVRSASRQQDAEPPPCVQQFAESLSGKMDQLLTHSKTGMEFRRLRALLLLTKVFGWGARLLVPADIDRLAGIKVREIRNTPLPLRELPLVVSAAGGKPQSIVVRGGVMMNWDPEFSFPGSPEVEGLTAILQGSSIGDRKADGSEPAAFGVESVEADGRRLLRIDISAILGLRRRVL